MGLWLMRHEQALGKQRIIQPFPAIPLSCFFFLSHIVCLLWPLTKEDGRLRKISDHPRFNQGVQAIFTVTNFWEHMFTGSSSSESRDKEVEQGMHVRAYYSHSFLNQKSRLGYRLYSSHIQSTFPQSRSWT